MLRGTSVLTCLAAAPSPTAFRPPYAGATKPLYDSADLQLDLLLDLTATAGGFYVDSRHPLQPGETRCAQFARYFARPWLLHVNGDGGEYVSALDNATGYYSASHMIESEAALLMCCDLPDRDVLVRNFIQYGIDVYWCAKSYDPGDTLRNDRRISKWPMLFAGVMLDVAEMQTPPAYTVLKTDCKTYFGDETHQLWTGWQNSGHPYAANVMWQMSDDIPESAFGRYEHWSPFDPAVPPDCSPWCHSYVDGECGTSAPFWKAEAYRRATHSWTWVGTALAARLMGARTVWNHDAFFAYVDRWMTEDETWFDALSALGASHPCGDAYDYGMLYREGEMPGLASTFTQNMWDAYRPTAP